MREEGWFTKGDASMRALTILFFAMIGMMVALPAQAGGASGPRCLRCGVFHQPLRSASPSVPDLICLPFRQPVAGPVSIFIYYEDPSRKTYAPDPKWADVHGKFCPGAWRFEGAKYVLLCNGTATAGLFTDAEIAEVRERHGLPVGAEFYLDAAYANDRLPADLE